MKKIKSHIVSFSILIIWVLIQSIYLLQPFALQLHKQFSKKIKHNIYVTLSVADWENVVKVNNEEVLIGGKMFDIKTISKTNENITLYGHYDSKEDNLVKQQNDFQQKKKAEKNSSFFSFLFYEELNNLPKKTIAFFSKEKFCTQPVQLIYQEKNISIPPPKQTVL